MYLSSIGPLDDSISCCDYLVAALRVAADGGANQLFDCRRGHSVRPPMPTFILQVISQLDGDAPWRVKDAKRHGRLQDLDVVIGDLDSIRPDVRDAYLATGTRILHDPDQDSTDFGKAVKFVRSAFPGVTVDIVALGGLAGRVDQAINQLHSLYAFQPSPTYAEGRLFLVSPSSLTFLLKPGLHHLRVRNDRSLSGPSLPYRAPGRERPGGTEKGHVGDTKQIELLGKYVGILPLKARAVITTRGLQWDVTEWETEMGAQVSTNNIVREGVEVIEVETNADVLFTISLAECGLDSADIW